MRGVRDASVTLLLVALTLCALEAGLRLTGVNHEASFYIPDRDLGYTLRPGTAGWHVKEHETYVRISSQGLRDREHEVRRPDGVLRIAVVGDSYSEAKEVAEDATYWSVMEREINRRLPGGRRVEVMNFGVDGYGLGQEYFVIKDRIWRYDPQVVILTGTLHSFILRSNRKFGTVAAEGSVPYFTRRGGRLVLDDLSERQRRDFAPLRHVSDEFAILSNSSRVLSLFNEARREVTAQLGELRATLRSPRLGLAGASAPSPKAASTPPIPATAPEAPLAATPSGPPPPRDNEDAVLRGPADSDLAESWDVAEGLIAMARDETERHHAEFWLVLLDMGPQVDPDPAIRAALSRELGIDDLFVADRRLAAFARREGIRHEMLARRLLAYAERHDVLLHGFPHRPRDSGHWNETGHRAAGEALAETLADCSAMLRGAAVAAAACGEPSAARGL